MSGRQLDMSRWREHRAKAVREPISLPKFRGDRFPSVADMQTLRSLMPMLWVAQERLRRAGTWEPRVSLAVPADGWDHPELVDGAQLLAVPLVVCEHLEWPAVQWELGDD